LLSQISQTGLLNKNEGDPFQESDLTSVFSPKEDA
jgi:hypothetical protein